ncbi:hypothetical protein HK105_200886 [Polyrhizophydium stewartii]|uniref:Uncharacterized protein n=1 Tax=Polyrhizophydium stewartii TaxID=2732419 RepID=A0ABR4NI87_9FUNG
MLGHPSLPSLAPPRPAAGEWFARHSSGAALQRLVLAESLLAKRAVDSKQDWARRPIGYKLPRLSGSDGVDQSPNAAVRAMARSRGPAGRPNVLLAEEDEEDADQDDLGQSDDARAGLQDELLDGSDHSDTEYGIEPAEDGSFDHSNEQFVIAGQEYDGGDDDGGGDDDNDGFEDQDGYDDDVFDAAAQAGEWASAHTSAHTSAQASFGDGSDEDDMDLASSDGEQD